MCGIASLTLATKCLRGLGNLNEDHVGGWQLITRLFRPQGTNTGGPDEFHSIAIKQTDTARCEFRDDGPMINTTHDRTDSSGVRLKQV